MAEKIKFLYKPTTTRVTRRKNMLAIRYSRVGDRKNPVWSRGWEICNEAYVEMGGRQGRKGRNAFTATAG